MKKNQLTTTKTADLVLGRSKSLLKITQKILSNTSSNTLVDDSWMERLWKWADENIVSDSSSFPMSKNELLELTILQLRWNRLVDIPEELFYIKQLKILKLNNNNIASLPSGISDLENLEELYLNINNLIRLPNEIIQLKKLKVLNIKNNKYLDLSGRQIGWLESLIANGVTVKYDKYKFNLGE